jgi:hypothetical protein
LPASVIMARAARDEGIKGLVNMSQGATVEVCSKLLVQIQIQFWKPSLLFMNQLFYHYDATCINLVRFLDWIRRCQQNESRSLVLRASV